MPFMRRRPLLRAAAIGGGAYAIGKHSANKQAEQQQQAYDEGASSTAPPAAAPASSGITQQDTERLAELGRLHDSGVLTDEEFAQQKSRILGV
jgi:hypothetical protein